MVHEGDAAHLHVTTKTQINLHNTQKIRTTAKKYKTIITSYLTDSRTVLTYKTTDTIAMTPRYWSS